MAIEKTGHVVFLNCHEYSDLADSATVSGCLAVLKNEMDETAIYTTSVRLQTALEAMFITKTRVTVSLAEATASVADRSIPGFDGTAPHTLRAIWTLK